MVLGSEPLIDALARDLRARAVETDLKGRYMWLPEDDVAPRVSSTARAILALPVEPGVNLAELIGTARDGYVAWTESISATLGPIGIANLQRSANKLMGTDLEVLDVSLRGHLVCEFTSVALPMPCALKGDALLHIPGLGASLLKILRAQTELVQQTSTARSFDAIQANAAPAAITLCLFDPAKQALFARETRWRPDAADQWHPGHTESTGHMHLSVSELGCPSWPLSEGGADIMASHGHSGTLNVSGQVFWHKGEELPATVTVPQLLELVTKVGTPGGPTGAKIEWSLIQQQRQLVGAAAHLIRKTPYGGWHPIDTKSRVAVQRAARCDPHELRTVLDNHLDETKGTDRTILRTCGLGDEEARKVYLMPRMSRAGVTPNLRTRMEHAPKAARGSVVTVGPGGGGRGGRGGRGGGRDGRGSSVPKQLKVPAEHIAYMGKLVGDAALLNATMLLLRGTAVRVGDVEVTAVPGSWPAYPLATPAADETAPEADVVRAVLPVDNFVWRYTSSSADKQGQWHYELRTMQAAGVWSTDGSEAAVTLISISLVLLKEVLAEMEIAKHIPTLSETSTTLPMMAMLLRGCDTPAGRHRWLAEVGLLFTQRRLMQRDERLMCSCNLPDLDLVELLKVFASMENKAFSDLAAVQSLGEVQDFFKPEALGGPSRAILAFREVAMWHKEATREGSTDMSEMTAAKKMRSHLGSGAPEAIVEEACKQSVERLATLQAHLPRKAMRLLMVLLDPRRPRMYKEGLTCEEPNMLQWFGKTLLGQKPPRPKGLELRATAELSWARQPCQMAFHAVAPPLSLEQLRTVDESSSADTSFKQVDLVLPEFTPAELEAIAEVARGVAQHLAQGIVSAPLGVREIVTKKTPTQVEMRAKQSAARMAKKAKMAAPLVVG